MFGQLGVDLVKLKFLSYKKLRKKYHGKNIEFVSLSIDVAKDHGKWKQMIKDKKLGGIQLFADSDWKSKFVTDYGNYWNSNVSY